MINLDNIEDLEKNPPATDSEIDFIEKEMEVVFPKVYRELLLLTNGFINGEGIGFYGLNEVKERNQTWQVDKYAKGYIAVGDNSGGTINLKKSFFMVFLLLCMLLYTSVSFAVTYKYDDLNRLTEVIYDDGTTVKYT